MAQSLSTGGARDLWVEAKKRKSGGRSLPTVVDGVEGVEDVCALFKDKYEALYNSVSYKQGDMNDLLNDVSNKVSDMCNSGQCRNHHAMNVGDVKYAVKKLKAGKSDANVSLNSDNFIFACDDLYVHLSLLLNMLYKRFNAPHEMLISYMVPIPKNRKKALNDSNNYRSIAISSIVGKVLDHIVLKNHSDVLHTSDLQFGFKPQHSTTQCTFILQEVVDYYTNRDSPVFVTLLDATRAFDRVHYVKLFRLMLRRGMCPSLIKLLISMYTGQSLVVRWAGVVSCPFSCSNGIKQGGVLSPVLFCVYIEELISRLRALNIGCFIGHKFAGVMTYADDVTLMAPTHAATMKMLEVCRDCANDFDVLFNSSKSNVILFKPRSCPMMQRPVITFQGEVINYTERAVHLGSILGKNASQENVKKAITDLYMRTNYLCSSFAFCDFNVSRYLFNSHCSSFYGSPLWKLNLIEPLCIAWRKCIRWFLKLHPRTHSRYISHLVNRPDLLTQFSMRCFKFWKNAFLSDNEVLSICAQLATCTTSTSNVAFNLRSIAESLNTNVNALMNSNINTLLYERWQHALADEDVICCDTIIELMYMRSNNNVNPLSSTEINEMINFLCMI